jgi:hypothetical protein
MSNRLNTYPTNMEDKNVEKNTIKYILQQNQYKLNEVIIQKLEKENNEKNLTPQQGKYLQMDHIHILRTRNKTNHNTNISFRTINTVQKHLQPKQYRNKYNNTGVYRLRCMDCSLIIHRANRTIVHTRYKEHIRAIKYNKNTFKCAQHVLNTGHTYGNIQNTMEIIQTAKKGKYMNSIEKY